MEEKQENPLLKVLKKQEEINWNSFVLLSSFDQRLKKLEGENGNSKRNSDL